MRDLIVQLIPHAPHLGLYVTPDLPDDRVRNALQDYAGSIRPEEVLALYDATLLGNARDGAVFAANRVVFQNNNLQPTHEVRYEDIVGVSSRRRLLGGRRVRLQVNRGRATVNLAIDFSGKPGAAEFVERFLAEAMMRAPSVSPGAGGTDLPAVREALAPLVSKGKLSREDFQRIIELLGEK
jgi:hypothetical protein